MVDGHETRKKLAVVDLDGTLVAGNTLHIYIKCALTDALRRGNVKMAAILSGLAALRAARLISHRGFKFRALDSIRPSERLRRRFTKVVSSSFRPEVLAVISGMKSEGIEVLLASAAPGFYIPWFWNGDFIATPIKDNTTRTELRGTMKLMGVNSYAEKHGLRLYAVITDHSDDLPLLKAGAIRNILVKPSANTLMTAKLAGVAHLEVI